MFCSLWKRLAAFALDLIRLTPLAVECQLGIVKEMLSFGLFEVLILLVTPLRIFGRNAEYR